MEGTASSLSMGFSSRAVAAVAQAILVMRKTLNPHWKRLSIALFVVVVAEVRFGIDQDFAWRHRRWCSGRGMFLLVYLRAHVAAARPSGISRRRGTIAAVVDFGSLVASATLHRQSERNGTPARVFPGWQCVSLEQRGKLSCSAGGTLSCRCSQYVAALPGWVTKLSSLTGPRLRAGPSGSVVCICRLPRRHHPIDSYTRAPVTAGRAPIGIFLPCLLAVAAALLFVVGG